MTSITRRALIIEDESAQRIMYIRALKSFGYAATGVETGAEAMDALDEQEIGVVILDLNLSGEHGLDIFEQIRDRHPVASVIIATGYGTFEIVKKAVRLDVVDFLSKPVGLDELEEAVSRAWARHELVQTPVRDLQLPEGDSHDDELDAKVARFQDLNMESIERAVILEALRRAEDNRKAAATMLGLSERTLYYRLSQYRVRRR